jgi:archaeoflavoprotein AfpA
MKIVWGITGAGDFLPEVIHELESLKKRKGVDITTCFSKAANLVVRWYGLYERVKNISTKVLHEQDANTPFIAGPLQIGTYNNLLVAPATANTVAKIVNGIADTLITNAVSQTLKGNNSVFILPVDQKHGKKATRLPSGEEKILVMRDIDIENTNRLKTMSGIKVLNLPYEIKSIF